MNCRTSTAKLFAKQISRHISAMREASFIKFGTAFETARSYLFRSTNDCFLWNIWIFYSLRKARIFYMTVPVVYNFQSLSNKISTTLARCRLSGFWVTSFIFLIRFCFTFLFSRLNSQQAMKIYSSKGIRILLWSASPFVCDINLIILVVMALTPLEETEGIRIAPRIFANMAAGGIIFSSN